MKRSPITLSHFRFRLYSEATAAALTSALTLRSCFKHVTLHSASSSRSIPRRTAEFRRWEGRGDIYVLFLSNFVSPGQSRSRLTIWDFKAERRWAPEALMVITCPRACGAGAVEASSCTMRDLRGTQTTWVTSTLILNTRQLVGQLLFLFVCFFWFFF